MTSEQIAKVCHEANRAYCETLGDTSQPKWEDAPEWQRKSAIAGVQFHIEWFKVNGVWPAASHSHESWLKQKEADGWKYGPVKDPEKKEHPCFVPYRDLPEEQKVKDRLFGGVVQAYF